MQINSERTNVDQETVGSEDQQTGLMPIQQFEPASVASIDPSDDPTRSASAPPFTPSRYFSDLTPEERLIFLERLKGLLSQDAIHQADRLIDDSHTLKILYMCVAIFFSLVLVVELIKFRTAPTGLLIFISLSGILFYALLSFATLYLFRSRKLARHAFTAAHELVRDPNHLAERIDDIERHFIEDIEQEAY